MEKFNPEKALQVLEKLSVTHDWMFGFRNSDGWIDLKTLFYRVHAMERFSYRNFGHTVLHDLKYKVLRNNGNWIYPSSLYRMILGASEDLQKEKLRPRLKPYVYPKGKGYVADEFGVKVEEDLHKYDSGTWFSYMDLALKTYWNPDRENFLTKEDRKAISFVLDIEPLFFDCDFMCVYPEVTRHRDGEIIELSEFLEDPTFEDVAAGFPHRASRPKPINEWFKGVCERLFTEKELTMAEQAGWEFDPFSRKFPLHPDNETRYMKEIGKEYGEY